MTLLVGRQEGHPACKYWVVGCLRGYLTGARCSWCHCLSLASVKCRLVLPFWYRLTRVVPEKWPLNGWMCACVPPQNAYESIYAYTVNSVVIVAVKGTQHQAAFRAIFNAHPKHRHINKAKRPRVQEEQLAMELHEVMSDSATAAQQRAIINIMKCTFTAS